MIAPAFAKWMDMKRLPLMALTIWALLSSTTAWSAVSADFFDVEVQVEDQSSGERVQGFSRAAELLLQRLSGVAVEDIQSDPAWSAVTNNPGRYIERYTYRAREDEEDFDLRVQFSARPLQEWLMARGLPLWPPQRPQTTLWLVVDDGGRQLLHRGDEGHEVIDQVNERAGLWGLPLRWPDGADVGHRDGVAAGDVTAGFDQPLLDTAKEYGPGPVVAVVLSRRSGQWHWQWRWLNGPAEMPEGSRSDPDRSEAIEGGFDELVQTLARSQSLVVSGDALKQLNLQIEGVERLEDLAAIREVLDSWVMVKSITERRVEEDQLRMEVALHGTRTDLLERLEQSGRFELLNDRESASVTIAPRSSLDGEAGAVAPVAVERGDEAEALLGPIRLRWLAGE
jgi:hypothetical protein